MQICVFALGKIGLPLAVQYASLGHSVTGVDIAPRVIGLVNAGEVPFPGETGLDEGLKRVVAESRLTATPDGTAAVAEADAVVIVVPLIVDQDGVPDFGPLDAATNAVAAGLRPGTLVSYETTLPVGTTRERFAPMLTAGSGLTAGEEFALRAQSEVGEGEAGKSQRGGLSPGDQVPEGRERKRDDENGKAVRAQVRTDAPESVNAEAIDERAQCKPARQRCGIREAGKGRKEN